ncbi:MAG: NAD(P)-dependent oxidoreductase [Pseudomonadota bacterium]
MDEVRGRPASVDVASGRLSGDAYARNFDDVHPPLDPHEALVEADRCYFCYDAPCTTACPTSIDIPLFIRQISTKNPDGAARTIFAENILGGMCARVCPTETLCEEACVRNLAEDKPVQIGLLQRYATDHYMTSEDHPFERGTPTGKRVAVVGAGPAGLACAHGLARLGHEVRLYDARPKPGGLNEYGIAAYKTVDGFAQKEVDFVLAIGGIELINGKRLGGDTSLAELRRDHDAVFLGIGLGGVNALACEGDDLAGVVDAVDFIAELRQATNLASLAVGRRVVVIGGGMTAIDVAVQSKLLGAEDVTIAYRRGPERMGASAKERDHAQTRGVRIKTDAMPRRILGEGGHAVGVEFERTETVDGKLVGTGDTYTLDADVVFRAIGQSFLPAPLEGDGTGLRLDAGRIAVDAERRTSVAGIWAGGDCVAGGEDLTVVAVEDGKLAAASIHTALTS